MLRGIESYYSLPSVGVAYGQSIPAAFSFAWDCLRRGISFSNISADDLAFVYENTLITPETRQLFGTHSTPRQLAEYVVQRLELHHHRPDELAIYEPFTGAGVFLVSALRHLRDLLPVTWTDQQRHNFLIERLAGDEVEPFACEVAKLSLILADYPNHNGWRIEEIDLFEGGVLNARMRKHNVILCNPPFESFSKAERARYSIGGASPSKATAVLDAALEAHPTALGFVLPRPFIVERQFANQRRKIEQLYEDVEIVELPDRIFNASSIEGALLIARGRRAKTSKKISVRSTEIADRDRVEFLKTGKVTIQRRLERDLSATRPGELWIPPLSNLWTYVQDYPRLNSVFDLHLGARWTYDQKNAVSSVRKKGFRRGLFSADDVRQFNFARVSYIDLEPSHLTHATARDWNSPKIIVNGVRLSRGPWRLAAAVDREGLAFSQQLLGLWPANAETNFPLHAYAAVLNGPLANAFLSTRYPSHRFRLESLGALPLPPTLPTTLGEAVSEYVELSKRTELFARNEDRLSELLFLIDALALEAYDLPIGLEQELLDYFSGATRPISHKWKHWNESDPSPELRLAERIADRFQPRGNWTRKVFTALPEDEAALLRKYGN